ncbi:hypothetical protein PGB90_006772 [Kerria lacca]
MFSHRDSEVANEPQSANKHSLVKITKNSFFNFRAFYKHTSRMGGPRNNAVNLSINASHEWNSMEDDRKKPFRELAHICKINGGKSFFVNAEYLVMFVRHPECFRLNNYTLRPIRNMMHIKAIQHPSSYKPKLVTICESPQPHVNFGGYETMTLDKGKSKMKTVDG